MNIKLFTNSVDKIYFGTNLVSKIYIGNSLVYEPSSEITFDYVYKILDLIYMVNIQNSIYNLDYDLSSDSVVTILNNSYIYENDKVYSWF